MYSSAAPSFLSYPLLFSRISIGAEARRGTTSTTTAPTRHMTIAPTEDSTRKDGSIPSKFDWTPPSSPRSSCVGSSSTTSPRESRLGAARCDRAVAKLLERNRAVRPVDAGGSQRDGDLPGRPGLLREFARGTARHDDSGGARLDRVGDPPRVADGGGPVAGRRGGRRAPAGR